MDFSRSLLLRLIAATPLAALGCEGASPTTSKTAIAPVTLAEPLPLVTDGIARSLYSPELELRAQPVTQHRVVSADDSNAAPIRLPKPEPEEAGTFGGPTIAPPDFSRTPSDRSDSHLGASEPELDSTSAPQMEWDHRLSELERLPPTDQPVLAPEELWLSVPDGRLPPLSTEIADNANPPASVPPQPNSNLDGNVLQAAPMESIPQLAQQASPPQRGPERARSMHAVSGQAAVHVRRGFTLAGRGAHYSARSEFIQALRLVSAALDAQTGTGEHGQALAAGLRALEESDDFVPGGSLLEANMDVALLIPAHRTPVLKDLPPDSLTVLDARKRYYTYAQEQLTLAAGHERSGSMALYGMGRVQSSLAEQNSNRHASATPKAIALHQAALRVDMDNFMAANELGVLLARFGQYEQARAMLVHSVRLEPQAASWHNLAVVHEKLGQYDLAVRARQHSTVLTRLPASSGESGIVWTDIKTFARPVSLPAEASPPVTREASKPHPGSRN